jgi:hypothetical protein
MRKFTLATLVSLILTFSLITVAFAQSSAPPSQTASAISTLTGKLSSAVSPQVVRPLDSVCYNTLNVGYPGGTAVNASANVTCTPSLAYGTLNVQGKQCYVLFGACLWYTSTVNINYCTISVNNNSCSGYAILGSGMWCVVSTAYAVTSNGEVHNDWTATVCHTF